MPGRKQQLTEVDFVSQLSERLRLNAARPDISGYRPYSKQQQFHGSPKRNRLLIGGNRSGKTVAGVVEDIHYLRGTHPERQEKNYAAHNGGCRGRIVGVDFDNGIERIIIPEVARWLPPSALKGGSWETAYEKGLRNLTLENGSTCEFMSYIQDTQKFSGTSRHFIHFDEEPPEEVFKECKMRLMDVAGDWWMTLTPLLGMEWMYDDIYMIGKNNPDGDIEVIEMDTRENPYLRPEEVLSTMAASPERMRISVLRVSLYVVVVWYSVGLILAFTLLILWCLEKTGYGIVQLTTDLTTLLLGFGTLCHQITKLLPLENITSG